MYFTGVSPHYLLVLVCTGGSSKYTTSRHQCIQDNVSQQPLGVRTLLHFYIINNEVIEKFKKKFKKNFKPNGHDFKFE